MSTSRQTDVIGGKRVVACVYVHFERKIESMHRTMHSCMPNHILVLYHFVIRTQYDEQVNKHATNSIMDHLPDVVLQQVALFIHWSWSI